jgi:hypothetical protein
MPCELKAQHNLPLCIDGVLGVRGEGAVRPKLHRASTLLATLLLCNRVTLCSKSFFPDTLLCL